MNMNRALTILGGVGAGLAAVYFLDPKKGSERRAKLKEFASTFTDDARQAISHKVDVFKETATGFAQGAKGLIEAGGEHKSPAGFTNKATGSKSTGTNAKRVH